MKKIDIKGGDLTFGQRIELGRIISDPSLTETRKCIDGLRVIDPGFRLRELKAGMEYWREVLEGILFWVRMERQLEYKPTDDELRAGIKRIHQATGEMATVMALAKDYGKDPDEILGWKYGKVYGILLTDLKQHEFERELHKIQEKRLNDKRKWRKR